MKLLAAQTGWAQSGHHLYWTTDNGAHWKDITPPKSPKESIGGIFFLDTSNGWALLSYPGQEDEQQFRIAATSDAGATWSISGIRLGRRAPEDFSGEGWIDFVDSLHGWLLVRGKSSVAFSWGTLLSTKDGGRSWVPLGSPPIGDHFKFVTAEEGWLAGGPGGQKLYLTRDGAKHWQQVSVVAPRELANATAVYDVPVFLDAKRGFLAVTYSGSALALFETKDGGVSWAQGGLIPKLGRDYVGFPAPTAVADSGLFFAEASSGLGIKLTNLAPGRRVMHVNANVAHASGDVLGLSFATGSRGWISTEGGLLATQPDVW